MAGDGVLELTDNNFEQEVISSDQPVLVDFWAEWCMPCRMIAPTIEEVAKEYAGKVKVGKVDTDANRDVSMKFGISAIPTIMLFHNGEVVHKFVGLTKKEEFESELDKVLSNGG
jgi:thioredoxin 1